MRNLPANRKLAGQIVLYMCQLIQLLIHG